MHDGEIVAAAQEERFSRRKFEAGFPTRAALWSVGAAGLRLADLEYVVFGGPRSFAEQRLRCDLSALASADGGTATGALLRPLLFCEHRRAQAASAFFPSPFERAAVLCLDGAEVGATTSLWLGEDNRLTAA